MKNIFKKSLTGKLMLAFFVFHSLLHFSVHAQTKHPKTAADRPQAPPQPPPEPPNPYAAIDTKALLIPDSLTRSTEGISSYINANFQSNQDKVRAAFIWVASSIRYDVPNMYAINYYEKKEDKIAKPLQTHEGICENSLRISARKPAFPAMWWKVMYYWEGRSRIFHMPGAWRLLIQAGICSIPPGPRDLLTTELSYLK